MNIEKVTVLGSGNLGARLAFQIAYHKIDVTVYDLNYDFLENARTKFREFGDYYKDHCQASEEQIAAALANIAYSKEIPEAVGNAQLIIEAVTENASIKKKIFKILKKTAPKNAIFGTTSENLDLEALATLSGNPEKFVHLRFYETTTHSTAAELIGTSGTQPEVMETMALFAQKIGLDISIKSIKRKNEKV